ncbi:MAG: zf-HC2 domain-containing protein [Spirochaetes bacterium]|nr:zf-HC2 domain-containing protein [Spirochaetota bacterium]
MKCDNIKLLLADYLEGNLSASDTALVKEHLKNCADCREELQFLKKYMKKIEAFPSVKAPDDFLEQLHARIGETGRGSLVKKLFYPLKIKVPLEAAALLAIAVTGMIIFKPFRPEVAQYKAEEPASHQAMEEEKALHEDKHISHRERPPMVASNAVKAREKEKDAARDKKVAATDETMVAADIRVSEHPAKEEMKSSAGGQAEITLYLKQVTVARAEQEFDDSVTDRKADYAATEKALSKRSPGNARKDRAASAGATQQTAPAGRVKDEADSIAGLAQSLEGRIIRKSMDEKTGSESQIIVEIPRKNYSRFMKGLRGKWSVQKQYPSAPSERAGKVQFNINLER